MHIKEIRLKNFLSYGDCRVEFSPGVNAVYGLNGSGKSNLLKAVEYVLSRSFLKVHSVADLYRDVIYLSNNDGSIRPSGFSTALPNAYLCAYFGNSMNCLILRLAFPSLFVYLCVPRCVCVCVCVRYSDYQSSLSWPP